MAQPLTHPWPTWKWPDSGWLWTVCGAIIGGLVLVFPDMTKLSGKQRLGLAVAAALATLVFVLLGYAAKLIATATRRVLSYDDLRQMCATAASDLNGTKALCAELLRERRSLRTFQILYTFIHGDTAFVAPCASKEPD